MPRVSYVEANVAPPEVREIYEKSLGGKPGSVFKLLAHRPEMLKHFSHFTEASGGRSIAASTRWFTSASP